MNQDPGAPPTPRHVLAGRIRQLREARGLSQNKFAKALQAVGLDWTRLVVNKAETGLRNGITVDEVFAIAYVLGVPPVLLLLPYTDEEGEEEPLALTSTITTTMGRARAWFVGDFPVPGVSYLSYLAEQQAAEPWAVDETEERARYENEVEAAFRARRRGARRSREN